MQVVISICILILIGMIWLCSKITERVQRAQENLETKQRINAKWGNRIIDKSQSLIDRNTDVISSHLARLSLSSDRWYYLDDAVRDCISDIAEAEGRTDVSPGHRYLRNWERTAPQDFVQLKQIIHSTFSQRLSSLRSEKDKIEQEHIEAEFSSLLSRHQALIRQFLDVVTRKVTLRDSYGDENWECLPGEIDTVVRKIARKEGLKDEEIKRWRKYRYAIPKSYAKLYPYLDELFRNLYKTIAPLNTLALSYVSGEDFEAYLMCVLSQSGCERVTGTPHSGDQGGDILVDFRGRRIVIQAKCYSSTVGNKAVQEVAAAVAFYGADEGWVVTNSTFSSSARQLAQRTGVRLVDGMGLPRIPDILSESGPQDRQNKTGHP